MINLRKVDVLKLGNEPVITAPEGYYQLREQGNIYWDDGRWIYMLTCVRPNATYLDFDVFWWTSTNRKVWEEQGILIHGCEDATLKKYGGYYHLWAENKYGEAEQHLHFITHYRTKDIDNYCWEMVENYKPTDSGILNCQAIYSPLQDLCPTKPFICDGRIMPVVPHEEFVCIQNPDGTLKIIIKAGDHNAQSLGVGGSIFYEDGMYILEVAMLVDYPGNNARWIIGLMTCKTLTGTWKMINKELKTTNGKSCYAGFFKDGNKYYALAAEQGDETNIYLAEIIEKEGGEPEPPINGGAMRPGIKIENDVLMITKTVDGATKYRWQCDKSPGFWIGDGLNRKIPTHLRVNGNEFWCYAQIGDKRTEDSDRIIYKIEEEPLIPPQPPTNDIAKLLDEADRYLVDIKNIHNTIRRLL